MDDYPIDAQPRPFENRLHRNRMLTERSRNPAIRIVRLDYVRLYEQLLEEAPRGLDPA